MGQQFSDDRTPVRGGIFVQVAKTVFQAGETISGVIHINLEEKYKGHILQVSLQGFEETQFNEMKLPKPTQKVEKRGRFKKSFDMFLNYSIPIYDFSLGKNREGFTLAPGQWQIPFQFVIAGSLPSTFQYLGSNEHSCLTYRINATIIPTDLSIQPIQGVQEIFIGQLVNSEPIQQIQKQEVGTSTFCCCFGNEKFEIQVEIERQKYSPGETIVMVVSCDFSSAKTKVLSFNVALQGLIRLGLNQTATQKRLFFTEFVQEIKIEGKKVKERVQIHLPIETSLTFKGSLSELNYTLFVQPVVDGCCLNIISVIPDDGSNFSLPILLNQSSNSINSVQGPELQVPDKLQNWNPQQIEPMEFSSDQAKQIQQQQASYSEVEVAYLKQYLLFGKWV